LFRTLELYGFQRLPSSTGSHPKDAHRRDPVANAMAHRISWEELLDLADVSIANYNAAGHRGLGSRSPLEVLASALHDPVPSFIPRPAAPESVSHPRLGITVETRRVAGCAKKGRIKRPYVEIDKVSYTSPALSSRFDLLGKPIVVHIDEQQMASVKAFVDGGVTIGELTPQEAGWRRTPHTREMRKAINSMIDVGDISSNATDYVLEYLQRLALRAQRDIVERPERKSHAATVLADAARASGATIPEVPPHQVPRRAASNTRAIPGHIKQPSWRS
jgi:hypothetical protein